MAAIRHLEFLKIHIFKKDREEGHSVSPCRIFLTIGQAVAEIWRFINFVAKWRLSATLDPSDAHWELPTKST